ncbi:MAG: DEAD/DEAH box helicase [Bacteroidetes bacterium]|nr:DEAD/DEAH box helicase [Bacteroidota bacterium]
MVKLDLQDSTLIIDHSDDFKRHQSLQLAVSYGFNEAPNGGNLITRKNIENNLPKLIGFLESEKIDFELTESCEALRSDISDKEAVFRQFVETARTYKDGSFDPQDFQEHIDFLKGNIKRKLKDHQKKAFYHLCKVGNAANFSVPGSGKTTVVLSAYEKLRLQGEINLLFVIGPPACFGPWKREFKDVLGRDPKFNILAGGNLTERKQKYYEVNDLSELYLTTFQTLMRDTQEVCAMLQSPQVNAFVVIDEAHYIKQLDGRWANAALQIAAFAKIRCILTGTPIPKSYTDLFNMFDFLWPENVVVTEEEKGLLQLYEERRDFKSAAGILDPVVGPLFYRVRKKELGLKPQVFYDPIKIQMGQNERRVYNAIVGKLRHYANMDEFLKDATTDVVVRLKRGRMIRLRQVFSYAKLLNTAIEDYSENLIGGEEELDKIIYDYDAIEQPAKLIHLLGMAARFKERDEKVVIWANFVGTIDLIERTLLSEGFNCKKIYGRTPVAKETYEEEETREKIRDEFVDANSGLDILIANPAACAESISLHKTCNNAVYYDLSYNCAQYLQSLDRIHRVGGSEDKEAYYYFLQYEDTVEGRILGNLNMKAQKMYQIIEGDYNIYSMDMFDEDDDLDVQLYNELFGKG